MRTLESLAAERDALEKRIAKNTAFYGATYETRADLYRRVAALQGNVAKLEKVEDRLKAQEGIVEAQGQALQGKEDTIGVLKREVTRQKCLNDSLRGSRASDEALRDAKSAGVQAGRSQVLDHIEGFMQHIICEMRGA